MRHSASKLNMKVCILSIFKKSRYLVACHVIISVCLSSGDGVPTVFVAVAGRSNGLGPVMSGNTAYPVINCPPLTPDWGAQDVWSSLRMPSGEYGTSCLEFFVHMLVFFIIITRPLLLQVSAARPSSPLRPLLSLLRRFLG